MEAKEESGKAKWGNDNTAERRRQNAERSNTTVATKMCGKENVGGNVENAVRSAETHAGMRGECGKCGKHEQNAEGDKCIP